MPGTFGLYGSATPTAKIANRQRYSPSLVWRTKRSPSAVGREHRVLDREAGQEIGELEGARTGPDHDDRVFAGREGTVGRRAARGGARLGGHRLSAATWSPAAGGPRPGASGTSPADG